MGLILCIPCTTGVVHHPSRLLLRWMVQILPRHLCIRTVRCRAYKMKSGMSIEATDDSDSALHMLCLMHSSNPKSGFACSKEKIKMELGGLFGQVIMDHTNWCTNCALSSSLWNFQHL